MTINELITSLGIADDAKEEAAAAVRSFLDGAYVPKARFNEVNEEKKTLQTALAARDKQFETLKKASGDKEKLEDTIKKLQDENKAAKAQYETDMKNLRISSALKLKLAGTAQDIDIVAGLIDKTKITVSEDGTVTGLDEQINPLKESKPFLFKSANDRQFYTPNNGKSTINNPFTKEHFNLTEQGRMLRNNPEQAKAMALAAGVNIGGIN